VRTVRHRPDPARPSTKPAKRTNGAQATPKTRQTGTVRMSPLTWEQAAVSMLPGGGLRFVIPVLESANRIWRHQRGRTHTDDAYRQAKADASRRFRHVPKLAGPLEVWITWYRDKAHGDADNRIKPALDLLKGIAYADDASVCALHMTRVDDKTQPARLEIVVGPYAAQGAA